MPCVEVHQSTRRVQVRVLELPLFLFPLCGSVGALRDAHIVRGYWMSGLVQRLNVSMDNEYCKGWNWYCVIHGIGGARGLR